jgi:hypothetical protein
MIVDLLKGKIEDEDKIYGCLYEVLRPCCNDMDIGLKYHHIISSGIEMEIPDHEDNDFTKPIEGGLTISHCPWCGEVIACLNPWTPFRTADMLDKLAPKSYFWL